MSEIKVDTVAEKTSANGVTVDGLNIKDSKLVTANSVITSNVTDLNITSGKIADDAITLAKMASGTDGNIISYDASGNPVAVATGNDGQVLTSTGAGSPPAFETLPAGGKIIQVRHKNDTSLNQASTNSNSFQDVSGLDLLITPSSASNYMQIFLMYHIDTGGSGHALKGELSWIIGGTQNQDLAGIGGRSTDITADRFNGWQTHVYYHNPNTTSEITYRFQFKSHSNGQTVYFNRGAYNIIVNELSGTGA